ncbi:protein ALP1-like [Abeliophyllum distichum]|uniref:Protein ALP1-like n=1 Tax=Abeliophyllum distichum TaxID=126358 RepID=A0ABD1QZH2_9LAMI
MGRFGHDDSSIFRNPDSFKQFFKINTSTFEWLCGLLETLLDCCDPIGSHFNLPTKTNLGIGLFWLANSSDFPEISHRFQVSEAISKFNVKQLCHVLCTNFHFWVGFRVTKS